jgi:hypothetical protein
VSLYLVASAVVVVAFLWLRAARRARLNWVRALDLVGQWDLDSSVDGATGEARSLTLSGGPLAGPYVARDGDTLYRGTWRLAGVTLTLEPAGVRAAQYELLLFGAGRIGIDGPGRQREIYVKRDDNVIPFRARS